MNKREHFQIIDSVDSESEDNRNDGFLRNENDDKNGASLIENIFDFLALNCLEL